MPIYQQFIQSLCVSPFIIVRGNARFFIALFFYISLGVIVFGGFSYLLINNQEALRQLVMDYFLPQSWHSISDRLINFFFESQTKIVLVSMIVNGSMVVASIILFPVKEYCSKAFEVSQAYNNGQADEFPLWLQGLEECKLLAIYIAVQSVILAIGYYPYVWCSWVSNTLSIVFLCFSFGLDFISPTLQRQRIRYSSIIKVLLKNIAATMTFGAVFSIPVLLLGRWILQLDALTLAEITAILFMVNIFVLAVAIPAGTHIASQLLPYARQINPPSNRAKTFAYGFFAVLLTSGVSFHSLVGMSMHHKSQFLKCEYDINFSSFDVDMPSLLELARGEKDARLSFDLRVHNPTPFDLAIEQSHLSIWQNEHLISRILITELNVDSGSTINQTMTFKMHLNTQMLAGMSQLLDGWSAQIEFELMPGIPFIVQVL